MRHRVIAVVLLATLAGSVDVVRSAWTTRTRSNASYLQAARVFAPRNVSPPLLTGTPREGAMLGTTTGEWARRVEEFRLQWLRCDVTGPCVVVGEGPNIVLTAADVGHQMRSRNTATNASGSTAVRSLPTAVVTAAAG